MSRYYVTPVTLRLTLRSPHCNSASYIGDPEERLSEGWGEDLKEDFMKTSFEIIWEFLAPAEQFLNRREACERLWKGLPLKKQRQIYATFVWQREQRIEIEENPYFAISHCNPRPFNYNGSNVGLPNDTKLFIAKYGEHYGVYSKLDTEAFEMEDRREFN